MSAHNNSFVSWEDAVAWLRNQPEHLQLVTDCYYDDPLLSAAERYRQSDEWQAIRLLLKGFSGSALDVGAGRGIASYALAKDGFEVTALEPDPSALVGAGAILKLSVESNLPIQIVEKNSEKLPFSDDSFDLVFARAVLHHTKNLETACEEFFRVLKPGGILIAIREHVISSSGDLPTFLEQHPLHHLYGGEHAYLLNAYIKAVTSAGFNNLSVISPWESPINYAPYTIETLKDELADKISLGKPLIKKLARVLLGLNGVWVISRTILEKVDQRPGRLYSFVAGKDNHD